MDSHRRIISKKVLCFCSGCDYQRIDDERLHALLMVKYQCLDVDTVVCFVARNRT